MHIIEFLRSRASGRLGARTDAADTTAHGMHRTDIDGLRTVAVLPVVAFHIGVHAMRGGFVGVDVFFVISGFLITQMIAGQLQAGNFSLVSFYERRIRRIVPALLTVLFAVYVLGIVFFLPFDMVDLSKSVVAAALSASNFYFWLGAGYFDGMAISKPLLHTWSLAVEEQFYVLWPLLLILGFRYFRQRVLAVMTCLTLLSLASSAIGAFRFPNAAFYLPFTRFWELSVGGLLPLGAVPAILGPVWRNILAATGLSLIAASALLLDPLMPFPGLLALPACLGAAMVLLAGRDGETWVGKLLSLRPMVFIGLISYSLYLWHWPITVFQRNCAILMGGVPEFRTKLLILAVSMLVASLSWRFIEIPFRVGGRAGGWRRPSSAQLYKAALTGTATMIVLGVMAWTMSGFPTRYSARELRAGSFVGYDSRDEFRYGKCFVSAPLTDWRLDPNCLALSSSKKNYLVLGDSHAADLWYGFSATYRDVNFLQASAADCMPTVSHNVGESARCIHIMDTVYKDFLPHQPIDWVLLSARWKAGSIDNLRATLQWLNQHRIRVTLFGPTVTYDSPVPRLLVTAMRASYPALPQHHRDESVRTMDAQLLQLAKSQGVEYISMVDLLCSTASCAIEDESGLPLMYDGEHFTEGGSLFVAKRLMHAGNMWSLLGNSSAAESD